MTIKASQSSSLNLLAQIPDNRNYPLNEMEQILKWEKYLKINLN